MTIDDVRTLAIETLEPRLTLSGLESVEVQPYTASVGEDAFSVTARLRPNSPVIAGAVSLDAMGALTAARLMNGEARFPYLRFDHQDEASIVDDVGPGGLDH